MSKRLATSTHVQLVVQSQRRSEQRALPFQQNAKLYQSTMRAIDQVSSTGVTGTVAARANQLCLRAGAAASLRLSVAETVRLRDPIPDQRCHVPALRVDSFVT